MTTAQTPAGRLLALLNGVRETGRRQWRTTCPVCQVPFALRVVEARPRGPVGMYCLGRRHCMTNAVLIALRLPTSALFPATPLPRVARKAA